MSLGMQSHAAFQDREQPVNYYLFFYFLKMCAIAIFFAFEECPHAQNPRTESNTRGHADLLPPFPSTADQTPPMQSLLPPVAVPGKAQPLTMPEGPHGDPSPSTASPPMHPAQAVLGDLALLDFPGSRKQSPRDLFGLGPRPAAGSALPAGGAGRRSEARSRRDLESSAGRPQLPLWDLSEEPQGGAGPRSPGDRLKAAVPALAGPPGAGPGTGASSSNKGKSATGEGEGKNAKAGVTRPGAEVLLAEMREQLDLLRSLLPASPLVPPGVTAKSLREGELPRGRSLEGATVCVSRGSLIED